MESKDINIAHLLVAMHPRSCRSSGTCREKGCEGCLCNCPNTESRGGFEQ